jgi:glycosyltransferase involved in cell wall biosynthesis
MHAVGGPPRQLRVGIGSRNYGYRRVAYDLPVPGVAFKKVAYAPWRYLRPGDPRWENLYCFRPAPSVDLYHLWNATLLGRKPWVTSFEAHLPRHPGYPRGWHYRLAMGRLHARSCRRILALSEFARRLFLFQNAGALSEDVVRKTEVLYGGVRAHPERAEARWRSLEPFKGPLTICMVGHQFFQKGGPGLVEGLVRARSRGADVRLVVVSRLDTGDFVTGATDALRHSTIEAIRVHPWIEWHAELPHDQVLAVMARSHLAALPTLDETFGWSAVEAMSLGLPVVATDVCAMPEIVAHKETGWIVGLPRRADRRWIGLDQAQGSRERNEAVQGANEQIAAGVATAIEWFLESPRRLREVGQAALDHVRRQHDPVRIASQLRRVYCDSLGIAPGVA